MAVRTNQERTLVTLDDRTLELSHLDKVLWPADGLTKADLIRYLVEVAPWMLPHLRGRPLTLTRFPDGIDGESFYQKDCPQYAPDWIPTYPVASAETGRVIRYILAEERATLAWLANQAALELHPWMSTVAHPDRPDVAVIDLDPDPPSGFREAREVAFAAREVLRWWGLDAAPVISGHTGIHLYIPLRPLYPYRVTSGLVGLIGSLLARAWPDRITVERLVRNRGGRVYVDHLQNLPGKTVAAPFSPRPRDGAPVAFPVQWEDLAAGAEPLQFTLRTAAGYLLRGGDPLFEARLRPFSLEPLLAAVEAWQEKRPLEQVLAGLSRDGLPPKP